MSTISRSELYRELKDLDYEFEKEFKFYKTAELQEIYDNIAEPAPAPDPILEDTSPELKKLLSEEAYVVRGRENEVIRVDEQGREWLQEEIVKSSTAKPRGYRVFRETGVGTKQITVDSGDGFTETFEVQSGESRPLEIKVGIPTWQVGIYRDPRLPFKIYTYRMANGYDREEVDAYFGGSDVLPENVVTTYVGNKLCYDIRSVNTAIQREFNQLRQRGQLR